MITNGLYLVETDMQDGVNSKRRGVMVFRDGTMQGGGSNFYTVGNYTCSDGKWKDEITVHEHTSSYWYRPVVEESRHHRIFRHLHRRYCPTPWRLASCKAVDTIGSGLSVAGLSRLSPRGLSGIAESLKPCRVIGTIHKAMTITYFVALPFDVADGGLVVGEPIECPSPAAAIERAQGLWYSVIRVPSRLVALAILRPAISTMRLCTTIRRRA
jgi:hypothetical protein